MGNKNNKIKEVINEVKAEDITPVPESEVNETEETAENSNVPRVVTDGEWEKILKMREKEEKKASRRKITPKKILVTAGAIIGGTFLFIAGKKIGEADSDVEFYDLDEGGNVPTNGGYNEEPVAQETENEEV